MTDQTTEKAIDLVEALRRERLRRGLSWAAYAKALDVSLETLYKLAGPSRTTRRPHDTTVAMFQRKLDVLTGADTTTPAGGADEVVSAGHGHD